MVTCRGGSQRAWIIGEPLPAALLRAGDAEEVAHRVVAFVTGVLERALVGPRQAHRERPGPRPGRRIVKRHRPLHRLRTRGREALNQAQPIARSPVRHFICEVRRLDHERVALEMSARVSHVLADRLSEVCAAIDGSTALTVDPELVEWVEWYHARLVDHLV